MLSRERIQAIFLEVGINTDAESYVDEIDFAMTVAREQEAATRAEQQAPACSVCGRPPGWIDDAVIRWDCEHGLNSRREPIARAEWERRQRE
jgi:hypothetical protein